MTAPTSTQQTTGPKARAPRTRRERVTFMLHKPGTYESLGKFQSSDPRYAALKCSSRGHTKILLRQTNTRLIYEYDGKVVDLETPKEITRGDPPRTITYTKKPTVKFVRKYVYEGSFALDEGEAQADGSAQTKEEEAQ